jgi:hypothetical protein
MCTDDFRKIVEDDDKFHAKSIGLLVLAAKILFHLPCQKVTFLTLTYLQKESCPLP